MICLFGVMFVVYAVMLRQWLHCYYRKRIEAQVETFRQGLLDRCEQAEKKARLAQRKLKEYERTNRTIC